MAKSDGAASATRATRALSEAGVPFETLSYALTSGDGAGASLGERAARALGLDPACVFKTLLADVDGQPTCGVVPVIGSLSLKVLAKAAGGKRAKMLPVADAERLTGYVAGGISPLGQLRSLPTFVDARAIELDRICVSAGKRGLQLRLAPEDLIDAANGSVVEGLGV